MTARICCILFVLILFLPLLDQNSSLMPYIQLVGAEKKPAKASWTVESWLNGSFQKQYAKRRESRLGLRSYLVKTFNQLHFSLFRRVVSSTGTNVIIGKKNWLYEKVYVDKLNTPSLDDGSHIEHKIQLLDKLQKKLARRGVALLYVIAPSKAELYPEYIPPKLLKPSLAEDKQTDYQQVVRALDNHGVNYVDGPALFLREKQSSPYQLFGPGGVHWNKYGAYLTWKEIASAVEGKMRVPLQLPPLVKVESRISEPVEVDLARLLNIWDTSITSPETDYPVFGGHQTAGQKPSILIVGDSFLFTLIDIIQRAHLATDVDAWYYFNRHFQYGIAKSGSLDLKSVKETVLNRKAIDWNNQLLNKDLVIIVATEYWLPEFDFGFVAGALAALQKQAEEKSVQGRVVPKKDGKG